MNDFDKAREVEAIARNEILPWLIAHADCVQETDASEFHQKVWGDWVLTKGGKYRGIELKAEQTNEYGNLFLETWSNRHWFTLGWMYTCRADWLYYYFVKQQHLYTLSMPALKAWAFGSGQGDGAIYRYSEKPQGKYKDQKNDTWGRPVPIKTLMAIPELKMNLFVRADAGDFYRQPPVASPELETVSAAAASSVAGLKGTIHEPWNDQF